MPTEPINANSPVDFQFKRQGGADIQAEIQVWPKKDSYSPTDRPVQRISFSNPLVAHESASISLPKGNYVCVFLALVREALNGIYGVTLTIEGHTAFSESGDVNTTPKPGDLKNLRADIPLEVA